MAASEFRWTTGGFLDQLDAWTERESLDPDLLLIVLPRVMERSEYPYRGVRREPGVDNSWFGGIPGSEDIRGRIVVWSYWVFEELRLLRCNSFSTLTTRAEEPPGAVARVHSAGITDSPNASTVSSTASCMA